MVEYLRKQKQKQCHRTDRAHEHVVAAPGTVANMLHIDTKDARAADSVVRPSANLRSTVQNAEREADKPTRTPQYC